MPLGRTAIKRLLVVGLLAFAAPVAADDQATCRAAVAEKAIPACSRLLKRNPKDAMLFYFPGMAYHSVGSIDGNKDDYDSAIADFNEAIRLNPNFALAFKERGYAYYLKEDHDRAIADYSEAIRLDPKAPSMWRPTAAPVRVCRSRTCRTRLKMCATSCRATATWS
jgi:tetratricopeptide (TPR) repeat protein